jgi:hypothetical protein
VTLITYFYLVSKLRNVADIYIRKKTKAVYGLSFSFAIKKNETARFSVSVDITGKLMSCIWVTERFVLILSRVGGYA